MLDTTVDAAAGKPVLMSVDIDEGNKGNGRMPPSIFDKNTSGETLANGPVVDPMNVTKGTLPPIVQEAEHTNTSLSAAETSSEDITSFRPRGRSNPPSATALGSKASKPKTPAPPPPPPPAKKSKPAPTTQTGQPGKKSSGKK
ncbi:hypothetical protein B0H21DRAFT_819188 [Amylocystis lapponica]|nr:hypothetical protein B0H21DRAFT_819188 [Amylocystis lapponica]